MKGLLTMVLTGKCWVMLPGHHEQPLTVLSFKNRLWLFSGKTGREDSWAGDIWTLNNNFQSH